MTKMLIATSNKHKVNFMRKVCQDFEMEVVTPKELNLKFDAEETGISAEENAIIKAKVLSEKVSMPIIAWDKGMIVENFPNDEQPGLFVRRVN